MNEPPDSRPQQAANGLRLLVLFPVVIAVGGVLMLATKLSFRFHQITEPPAQDYPPNPSPRAGASGQPIVPAIARPKGSSQAATATNDRVSSPISASPAPSVSAFPAALVAVNPPPTAASVRPLAPQTFSGTVRAVQDLQLNGIVGRVFLKGTPPPEKEIPVDPTCGKFAPGNAQFKTRFFVTDKDGGLADVFVWLFDFSGPVPEPPVTPLEIRQRGCEYLPYISAARAGQTVRVFNDDPLLHNVHPTPNVPGNPERNLAQLPNGAPLDFIFNKPEVWLRFKCDVHPWMFSYVSVVPHPFFAVTGTNGSFVIPEPPPGDYQLQILHRKTESRLVKLSVHKGRRLAVSITFDLEKAAQGEITVTEE